MANKAISELPQALNVNNQDLFVLEQGGLAKKLTAETFITEQGIIDALAEALDGHGGIQSVTLQSLSGRVRTYLITFSDGSATTFQVLDGSTITNIQKTSTAGLVDTYTVYMSDGTTTFFQVRNGQDGSATWDQINSKAPVITDTESGAIANFLDGADDMPVTSLVAEIEPVQDLNGYDSPWPGGGGANLLDLDKASYNPLAYGLTVARDGDGVRLTGTATQSGNLAFNLITNYSDATLSGKGYVLQVFDVTTGYTIANAWGFRTESERAFAISLAGITEGQVVNCFMKLSVAATSQALWSPYSNICPISGWTGCTVYHSGADTSNPETISISWQSEAGTVYGGTLNVTTGLLTVDAMLEVFNQIPDGGNGIQSQIDYLPTTGVSTVGDYTRLAFNARGDIQPSDYNLISSSYSFKMCNVLKHYFAYNDESPHWYRNTVLYAFFPSSLVGTTVTSVINYLQSIKDANPLSFWIPLAHPQTYQLTPQEVKTLLGTNNVWADTGDTSVTYAADTKIYCDAQTSSKVVLTATIAAADWTSSDPYTNSVSVNGLLATDTPIMDLIASSTYATAQAETADYAYIYKATCADNALMLYASQAPTVDLNVQLLCLR